jgi:hypothetical protein
VRIVIVATFINKMAVSDITTVINMLSKGTPKNAPEALNRLQKTPWTSAKQVEGTVLT